MPKQYEFVNDDTHLEILYSGAFGAGKSRALCCRAASLARYRQARVGLLRKTLVGLKATTMVTLLEEDGDLPPVLPKGSYRHHKSDGIIQLRGGGKIILLGCDNELKLGSTPLTDALIDEAIELEEKEYNMVLGRLRMTFTMPDGTKNRNSCGITTNPGSPGHFLHERFYMQHDETRLVINTNTTENFHLPDAFQKQIGAFTGTALKRYYLGEWVSFEGQVFWMYLAQVHQVAKGREPYDFYVAGVDWGSKNPAVIRVHGCNEGSYKSHVVSEVYKAQLISDQFVRYAVEAAKQYSPITFVLDPSAIDIKKQMHRAGLNAVNADNRVQPGIRCMEQSLSWSDGTDEFGEPEPPREPLLTMEPSCVEGNKEYPVYRWRDTKVKEEPVKEFDHAIDADRYARMYIMAGKGNPIEFGVLGGEPLAERRARREKEKAGITHIPKVDPLAPNLWPGSRM